jgi:hypothetical protein
MAQEAGKRKAGGRAQRRRDEALMRKQAEKRPTNYLALSPADQWAADKELGILDWSGK